MNPKRECKLIGQLVFDGQEIDILEGDTLGASLMRAGVPMVRRSRSGEPRGLYCAIGVCNDCLVSLDGVRNVRACVTTARPGARVQSGRTHGESS